MPSRIRRIALRVLIAVLLLSCIYPMVGTDSAPVTLSLPSPSTRRSGCA